MKQALAESRRNASVCGCSSMVEQKLPKLPASAVSLSNELAKQRRKQAFGFMRLVFDGKTKMAPARLPANEGLTNRSLEDRMAKTRIQGRAVPANRLSTWREGSELYAGRALGPFVIDDIAEGHELRRADGLIVGRYPDFAAAYAAMESAAAQWQEARTPWVYFIGSDLKAGAFVKIGTSINVDKRLKQLQAYSPVVLRILAKLKGGAELEGVYHAKFTFEWECKDCGYVWPVNTHPQEPCPTPETDNGR